MTCPKCGGNRLVPHEDGRQCLNCMKIIYLIEGKPAAFQMRRWMNRGVDCQRLEPVV